MTDSVNRIYRRAAEADQARVLVMMPKNEADAVDSWAVPAGMPSRTSAIRYLLRKGLETIQAEQNRQSAGQMTVGRACEASPPPN